MNYSRFLQLLRSRGNEVRGIHLGLHRMERMMEALGNPHACFPTVHIAGTNGKGSVAAMSESILRHAGWRTGLYTSPHLVRIEERVRAKGSEIQPRQLARLAGNVLARENDLLRARLLDRSLTYFEFITCCAFLFFAESMIDVAVVEVGLGGRLDATNVVRSEVCVITGIALDHTDLLGKTIGAIAREKAGIIKPHVKVVSGCLSGAARDVVRGQARRAEARIFELGRHFQTAVLRQAGGRATIRLRTPNRVYTALRLGLAGSHQARNAALAVGAVEALEHFPVPPEAVRRGVADVTWPGRMDTYRARRRTLLDGAHNPQGARFLAEHLGESRASPIHMVFGALRDKDVRGMASRLFRLAARIHIVPLANPRSMRPEEVAGLFPRCRPRMVLHASAREGLRAAWDLCPPRGLVVVTGSLYLVGEVLETVRRDARAARRSR